LLYNHEAQYTTATTHANLSKAVAFSIAQLQGIAAVAGFPVSAVPTAAAVAMAESGGNPNAVGDLQITPGGSIGLWQVNLKAHPSYNRASLFDPAYNALAALAISSGGRNWAPWSTFNSGAYTQYLRPYGPAAVPGIGLQKPTAGGVLVAMTIVAASLAAAWWITQKA
jgi:hypothetical protein